MVELESKPNRPDQQMMDVVCVWVQCKPRWAYADVRIGDHALVGFPRIGGSFGSAFLEIDLFISFMKEQ